MSDVDDLLDGKDEEQPEVVETPAPDAPAPAEAQPQGEPTPVQPEPKPEAPMVPLAALQEVRDQARDLRRELDQFRQAQQKPQEAPKVPDVFEDQQGYTQFIQTTVQQAAFNARLDMSEGSARDQYGDDVVESALAAAQQAGTARQFLGEKHPWGAMVKWHQRQQKMAEIGDDPDAWRERERERLRQEIMAEQAGQVASDVNAARMAKAPSLAGTPNLGTRQAPAWAGPSSLKDILGEK